MIFDTDVFIWYFRGNPQAQKAFHEIDQIAVTAVTVMELIQGARNKGELKLINKFLHTNAIRTYMINEEITTHAIHLLEEHTLTHGIEWGDALIGAITLHFGEEILTGNIKHYRFLQNVKIKKFNPN